MLKTLLDRLEALWHRIGRLGEMDRTVIAVTAASNLQLQLRVLSIQERWRLLFARTPEAALELCRLSKSSIVVYDRDLAGAEWRRNVGAFVQGPNPVFFILLSRTIDRRLWRTVLDLGGYDVVGMPLRPEMLAGIVNGAFNVRDTVNSVAIRRDGVPVV